MVHLDNRPLKVQEFIDPLPAGRLHIDQDNQSTGMLPPRVLGGRFASDVVRMSFLIPQSHCPAGTTKSTKESFQI